MDPEDQLTPAGEGQPTRKCMEVPTEVTASSAYTKTKHTNYDSFYQQNPTAQYKGYHWTSENGMEEYKNTFSKEWVKKLNSDRYYFWQARTDSEGRLENTWHEKGDVMPVDPTQNPPKRNTPVGSHPTYGTEPSGEFERAAYLNCKSTKRETFFPIEYNHPDWEGPAYQSYYMDIIDEKEMIRKPLRVASDKTVKAWIKGPGIPFDVGSIGEDGKIKFDTQTPPPYPISEPSSESEAGSCDYVSADEGTW